jgi:chromosome partitioning protein
LFRFLPSEGGVAMPVIVFASPKGGASVTVIDADPNRNVVDWAALPGAPEGLRRSRRRDRGEHRRPIEAAAARTAFVLVDLEGAASLRGR